MRIVVDSEGKVLMWAEQGNPAPPDGAEVIELTAEQTAAFNATPNERGLVFDGEAFTPFKQEEP